MYVKKLLCGYCKSHQGGSFKMELQFKENKKKNQAEYLKNGLSKSYISEFFFGHEKPVCSKGIKQNFCGADEEDNFVFVQLFKKEETENKQNICNKCRKKI